MDDCVCIKLFDYKFPMKLGLKSYIIERWLNVISKIAMESSSY